jgi:tetratricopeptide (TPR) repeat protein
MSTQALLRKARKLADAGDVAAAAAIFEDVLAKFPSNKVARQGLAALKAGSGPGAEPPQAAMAQLQALAQRGAFADLVARARPLTQAHPTSLGPWMMLAQGFHATGQLDNALKAIDRAAALAPKDPRPLAARAQALLDKGEAQAAAEAAARARALPGAPAALALLEARALSEAGFGEAALTMLDTLPTGDALPGFHIARGNVLSTLARGREAIEAFETARDKTPGSPDPLVNLANEYAKLEWFRAAIPAYEAALERGGSPRHIRLNLAIARMHAGAPDDAIEILEDLRTAAPGDEDIILALADAHWQAGNTDAALAALDTFLTEDPANLRVRLKRGELSPPAPDTDAFREIERIANSSAPPGAPRPAGANLILFQSLDKAGAPARAFEHLARAKAMREADHPYYIEALTGVVREVLSLFEKGRVPRIDATPGGPRPLFVVGMPRSGTTLVEQILSAHPEVHGAGELIALQRAMAEIGWHNYEIGQQVTEPALAQVASFYRAAQAQVPTDRPVIVNKTPLNFLWAGFALAAMPEARVLFMVREPMATCWSNFSRDFQGPANGFGNDIGNLVRVFRMHEVLRDLWREHFPDRVHLVDYDALTEDPEPHIRAMLEAAGLAFDPACLSPEKNVRAVRTASAQQVRRGIYTGSSQAWRAYESQLAPLRAALARRDETF